MTEEKAKKPIINMDFIRKTLATRFKAVKFPDVETLEGVPADDYVFSSLRLIEYVKKGCVAFVHARHEDPHYTKIAEVMRQRHAALPANDPNKLSSQRIGDEVFMYRMNELADKAFEKGTVLLISKRQVRDYPCILVPNVKEAFIYLYEGYMRLFETKSVQVTGSFGKTSSCQMVFDMLQANEKNTHRNRLNGNDYPGLFDAINKLEYEHEFYVQETQEAPVSWTASAASVILKPKVAIITNAGGSHLEVMKTKANVAAACLGIQDGIQPDGLLAINADDTLLKKQIRKLKVPTASYAIENKKADCFANNIKLTHSGTVFDLNYKGKTVQIKIASLGNHNVYNAMSSYIAGDHLELTEEEIVKGIESHKPEGLRQNLVTLNGRVFYIDCFNASVETMSAAVKIISDTSMESPEGKRIAILGSISELGAEKVRGHSKVGQAILKSNIDILICLGDGAGIIADVAKAKPGLKVFKAMDQRHLAQLLQEETASGDLILVKGSRTASLETAVDAAFGTYFTLDAQEKSDPPTITYGKFKANMYKAHTTITGYSGEKSTIAIADILVWKEGKQGVYNIFGIGEGAFKDKDFLKTIYLENPLKVIGKQAFSNCPNLAKILIPPSVVNIADDAFENSPVTIHGIVGSYAHEYAKKHGIEFAEHVETPKVTTFATVPIENITDTGSMVLVNYNNPLKEIPDISSFGLADLAVSVATPKTIYANEHALGAAQHFINTARDDEVGEMVVVAGFRDHSQQNYLYERNPKDGRTAKPHNSEHHTGLALDIFIRGIRQHEMEGSPQAKWLADNAHRFGLILRYPKGKEEITGVPHEPWHFRFVGKAHAHYMWENEMVFEEYLDFLKEKRNITVDIYGSKYQVFYQQPQDGGILVPNEFKCTVSGDNQGGYIITEDRHPALY